MTGLSFFGVQAAHNPGLKAAGDEDHRPFAITLGGVRLALAVRGEAGPSPADARAALHHHEQVVALAELAPVLPAPFPASFPSVRAARTWARRHERALSDALARICDCVELGYRLRVIGGSDAGNPAPTLKTRSGAAYLRAQAQALHATERTARDASTLLRAAGDQTQTHLTPLARDVRQRYRAGAAPQLVGSALVAKADWSRVVERLERTEADTPGAALTITGPFPPYSFTPPALAAMRASNAASVAEAA